MKKGQKTKLGEYYIGNTDTILNTNLGNRLKGKVQLILTSPPFPLNNKKNYGNYNGIHYLNWLTDLAVIFSELIKPNGSIVIELGNAWEPKRPIQSLLPLESLMGFVRNPNAGLKLCQQFICYNPTRLPSPAQWVTVNRIRAIDSYTHVWWMAKSDYPKADSSKVLRPYSKSMKSLLKRQKYNAGHRPSEHHISETSFLVDHGGSIPHNLFEVDPLSEDREPRLPNAFSFANTQSNDFYLKECRKKGITPHPARMPEGLAAFFIQFLTDPGDLVLDPFGGSNTTGFVAECLGRNWISIDQKEEYIDQSMIRFTDPIINAFRNKSSK